MCFMEIIFLCPFLCVFCPGLIRLLCVYVGVRAFCALPTPHPTPTPPPARPDPRWPGTSWLLGRPPATRLLARPARRCSPCWNSRASLHRAPAPKAERQASGGRGGGRRC
jgi:hypothetical protein